MALAVYTQSIIAVIWDFDRTLIPAYSQEPIFEHFGVDGQQFWGEVNALKRIYAARGLNVAEDTAYLLHMLTYVESGEFEGLTNPLLRELGAKLEFCPGMPELLSKLKDLVATDDRYAKHDIQVEHYVVSTGLRQLIEGSAVGEHLSGVWANEFIDHPPPPGFDPDVHEFGEDPGPIARVGYMVDNTTKTRAIFEINKGKDIPVNALVAPEDRRIPIANMIYVADGPSDVPVFSVINQNGGRSLGVYQPSGVNYAGVKQLQDEGRVHSTAPADYTEGSQAYLWLTTTVREAANRICDIRERKLASLKAPAGHVID